MGVGWVRVCPKSPVCLASGAESQKWAFAYLNGQHPYSQGSGQVDVGFKGVEDHRVTALGERTRGESTARGIVRGSGVRGQGYEARKLACGPKGCHP